MRGMQAGVGAAQVLASADRWRVLATFRKALYIGSNGGLVILVSPEVPSGPLHVVLDRPPPAVERNASILASPDCLVVDGCGIALSEMRVWEGPLPPPERIRAVASMAGETVRPLAEASALHQPPYRCRVDRAGERAQLGDFEGAFRLLAGLGPGLTPAGDDVLAGLVFMSRALWGMESEPGLVSLVATAETSEPSHSFLAWAARGQSIAPAHDLVVSQAAGDLAGAALAAERLQTHGASSGADFALGLLWGVEALGYRVPNQIFST